MLDQIIQLDQNFFTAINSGLSNPFFDWLMPLLRNRYFWSPLYLFIVVFLLQNYRRHGFVVLVFFLITFAIADYFSASVIKPAVERLRPCNDPSFKAEVNSLITCGSGFSFPSSHASNHFALGMFLITVFYRRWKWILPLALLWAFSISFSQVYVGVHYPLDVTAGGVLGCIIGYVTGTVFLTIYPNKKWSTGY